jgi:hypothetical protein
LRIAGLITKKYKKEAYRKFLYLREKIWTVQFMFNFTMVCVGFPTSLLWTLRKKYGGDDKNVTNPELI